MKRRQVNIVSLGCSKNLVDTERLLSMMAANGIRAEVTERPDLPADILVVNTCGFIGDAKEESIDTILHFPTRRSSDLVAGGDGGDSGATVFYSDRAT